VTNAVAGLVERHLDNVIAYGKRLKWVRFRPMIALKF
jgi:hypothetical protein